MIYIIRHGKTKMNQARLLQGRTDLPLDEEGIAQAREAAERLSGIRFSHVYSSPLERARQTAQIVAPYARPVLDTRLIEMDYGPYEGTDLRRLPPELTEFFRDFVHHPAPAGMEPLSDVVKRAGSFLDEIAPLGGDILVSTHAIAMKGMLEYLTPSSGGSYWSRFIGNCAIYAAENKEGRIGLPAEL